MKKFLAIFLLSLLFLPATALAACEAGGHTVVYVNGIRTTYSDAQEDLGALQVEYIKQTGDYSLKFLTGYNPSHIVGVGDVAQTAAQLLDTSISDLDLKKILLSLHPQITTRKVLFVGHSQGTFYTNEIYTYLLAHGALKPSIGVYNVATPASFVAGYKKVPDQGAYLTSQNDKVINAVRTAASLIGVKQPLPWNISIPLSPQEATERFGGHSFSGVYLAEAPVPIVSSVADALNKLDAGKVPNTADGGCFTPPPKDIAYYKQKAIFFVADTVAPAALATVFSPVSNVYKLDTLSEVC